MREIESPACGGVVSCAGQHAACLHPPGGQQLGSALPCSLLTAFMVSINLGDCRKCSQHWLHFEPPSLPPSLPHPHVCSAHRQWGDRARVLGTVAQAVWYLLTVQNRDQNGQALCFYSKKQRGDTVPHW